MKKRQRFIHILFLSISLSLLSNFANAVIVNSIYEGIVPLKSESTQLREQAIKDAYAQVLIKVSGNASVTSLASVQESMNQAKDYLQEYHYVQAVKSAKTSDDVPTYLFKTKFNPQAINHILSGTGQAIWGMNRPLLLVWLLVLPPSDSGKIETLVGNGSQHPALSAMKANLYRRGLPSMFPLGDLEDMSKLSISDIEEANLTPILSASARYSSDAILMGVLKAGIQDDWRAEWTLMIDGEHMTWDVTGQSLDKVVTEGADNVAEQLANHFAILTKDVDVKRIELRVSNIHSVTSYAGVLDYLRNLTSVKDVQVLQVDPDQALFAVEVIGGAHNLVQSLSMGKFLEAAPQMDTTDWTETELEYQLVS